MKKILSFFLVLLGVASAAVFAEEDHTTHSGYKLEANWMGEAQLTSTNVIEIEKVTQTETNGRCSKETTASFSFSGSYESGWSTGGTASVTAKIKAGNAAIGAVGLGTTITSSQNLSGSLSFTVSDTVETELAPRTAVQQVWTVTKTEITSIVLTADEHKTCHSVVNNVPHVWEANEGEKSATGTAESEAALDGKTDDLPNLPPCV